MENNLWRDEHFFEILKNDLRPRNFNERLIFWREAHKHRSDHFGYSYTEMSPRKVLSILLALLLVPVSLPYAEAFVNSNWFGRPAVFRLQASTTTDLTSAASLEAAIDAALEAGEDPVPLINQLESLEDSKAEPNRSPEFPGEWHTWWTDCPPPSNGQLGPFTGTSEQMIADKTSASYQNILRVPPNDWLKAVLDGIYEDWDGSLLTSGERVTPALDWGARHWKVTFLKLTISVFGFPLVQKEFPPDTARVWRTTYMKDNVRIVRAGKTGRLEEETIFYTKRQPKP